jgi:ATP-binding cassette, subfamily B, putative efflux pump
MIGAIICGLLKFSLALSLPGALAAVVGHVFATDLPHADKITRMLLILGLLLLAYAGRAPATYFRSYFAARAGHRTIFDIRRDLYRHIQRLSMTYHDNQRTGSTISRLINDLNAAQGILNQGVIAVSMDVIFLCGVVVFLFWLDWRLALASLSTLPIYGLVFHFVNPRLRQAATEVQEEMEEMSGEATEKLSGVQVVMSFAREKTEELKFFIRHRRYYQRVLRRIRIRVSLVTVAEFLNGLGPIVVICYGGYRVISGPLEPEALILFYGFVSHLYLPTRRLADYSAVLQEKLAAMDRVFELFDTSPDVVDAPGARPAPRPEGRVTFSNVSFGYNDNEKVLSGIDLDVAPGRSVAIVGRSGAGKSTLVSLVPRFYDPVEGTVAVDGRDVCEVTVRSLRSQIGIVFQDSILFSGSVCENILYGRHNATEREMRDAARMAFAHRFIKDLPDGYDTVIGERGVSLSGGQRQRLSIARAFLRDPRILILDEATSSLDSGAELVIQDALRKLMRGRTTFVIAHRLTTIIDCDEVVVLDQGRIVQHGTHDELVDQEGLYQVLCREQFGALRLHGIIRKVG